MKMLLCFLCLSSVGWIAVIVGAVSNWRIRRREETLTERAEAEFVGYKTVKRSSGRYTTRDTYQPTLRYTAGFEEYCVTSRYYHEDKKLQPGDQVIIYYDRNNPRRFRLEEESAEGNAMVIRLGLYFLAGAAVISLLAQIFVFKE